MQAAVIYLSASLCKSANSGHTYFENKTLLQRMQNTRNTHLFCSLDRAFSNYDERKTNEMHFQSKPYI
jgi:hypothetical protein